MASMFLLLPFEKTKKILFIDFNAVSCLLKNGILQSMDVGWEINELSETDVSGVSVSDTQYIMFVVRIPSSYFSSSRIDMKVVQYLPISGKGHGVLYVNHSTKPAALVYPNQATTQFGNPKDQHKPESFTETATDGI